MKKVYLFALINLIAVYSQAQYFQWAKAEGLWAYDYGYGAGLDNSGNLYVAGKYEQNAIFSGVTLPNTSTNHDGFLAKYDPSGNLVWIQTYGGVLGDYNHAMYCDKTSAVYVGGEIEGFNDVIYFPGSTTTLTTHGDNDIVIAKYDLNGNLQWAKSEGWLRSEKSQAITADNSGNVYISGYYTDTTNFNGTPLYGFGGRDMYVAKYDANGAFQWVRKAGGAGRDEGKAIQCDAAGNVYVCGMYSNNAMFGTQTFTCPPGYFEAFVAKYDPNGNLLWVKKGGGDFDDVAWGMTIDSQDKIYITGEFIGYGVFGPNAIVTAGAADVFVACYDSNGNELWLKGAGGSLPDRARGMGTDGTNLFITGQFGSTATFGSNSVTAADSSDIFVSALDNAGNFLWTSAVGGVADSLETLGYESGNGICAESSGNVYATGSLLNGGTFGNANVTGYKRTDAFVTKLNATPAGIHENYLDGGLSMYPNPGKGLLSLDLSKFSGQTIEINVFNVIGQRIESKTFRPSVNVSLDISSQPDGVYFAEIKASEKIVGKQKIIIQH